MKTCKSCGMPMNVESFYGTFSDGSKNPNYCRFCFNNGKFITHKKSVSKDVSKNIKKQPLRDVRKLPKIDISTIKEKEPKIEVAPIQEVFKEPKEEVVSIEDVLKEPKEEVVSIEDALKEPKEEVVSIEDVLKEPKVEVVSVEDTLQEPKEEVVSIEDVLKEPKVEIAPSKEISNEPIIATILRTSDTEDSAIIQNVVDEQKELPSNEGLINTSAAKLQQEQNIVEEQAFENVAAKKSSLKSRLIELASSTCLILLMLVLIGWVCRLNYQNSVNELDTQYTRLAAEDVAAKIQDTAQFDSDILSYNEINTILNKLAQLLNTQCTLLDQDFKPVYATFFNTDAELFYTSLFLSKGLNKVISSSSFEKGEVLRYYNNQVLLYPINNSNGIQIASLAIIHDLAKNEYEQVDNFNITVIIIICFLILSVIGICFEVKFKTAKWFEKFFKWLKFLDISLIILGVLIQFSYLYVNYQEKYESLVFDRADKSLQYLSGSLNEVVNKGYPSQNLEYLLPYYKEKIADSSIINSLQIVDVLVNVDSKEILHSQIDSSSLMINVDTQYISNKLNFLLLQFLLIAVVLYLIIWIKLGGSFSFFKKGSNTISI